MGTLFHRNSVSIPPKERSQESILVVGSLIPEQYLKFLKEEAQTSSIETQQSRVRKGLLSLRESSSVLGTVGLRPPRAGLDR